jgi:hypothetical protein
VIPGASGGGASRRATSDSAPPRSSDGDAPEVARGAVGFGSGDGGPEGVRQRRICEARTRRWIPEARARHRLLGGACPGVAPVGDRYPPGPLEG